MKFIFSPFLLLNSFFFCHNFVIKNDPSLSEVKDKVQLVIEQTDATLDKIRLQGNGHLLDAVEYHLKFVKEMSDKLNSHQSLSEIAFYQEQIYHRQNRILEELADVQQIITNFKSSNQTSESLIERTQKLIRETEEVIEEHPESPFVSDIQHENELVAQLIPVFEASSKLSPNQMFRIEQILARHELTLKRFLVGVIFNAL